MQEMVSREDQESKDQASKGQGQGQGRHDSTDDTPIVHSPVAVAVAVAVPVPVTIPSSPLVDTPSIVTPSQDALSQDPPSVVTPAAALEEVDDGVGAMVDAVHNIMLDDDRHPHHQPDNVVEGGNAGTTDQMAGREGQGRES